MAKRDAEENREQISDKDVEVFVEFYRRLLAASEPDKSSMNAFMRKNETICGLSKSQVKKHINNIGLFFYSFANTYDFDNLFPKDGGSFRPSDTARLIYERLIVIRDSYAQLREEISGKSKYNGPVVKVAATRIMGNRMLSLAFSGWQFAFHKSGGRSSIELMLDINSSFAAIERLRLGEYDAVICYGEEAAQLADNTEKVVAFKSLGYQSRMVLICHPTAKLPVKTPATRDHVHDLNAGYWHQLNNGRHYDDLLPVTLSSIDFGRVKLIVVPSWNQPPELEKFTRSLSDSNKLEVTWYEDALSLVRIGRGVAVMTEVFSRDEQVSAFRIEPVTSFTRQVGFFYRSGNGLTPQACQVVTFFREYLCRFQEQIRSNKPPGYGDEAYDEFCRSFQVVRDWGEIAKKEFG